MDLKALSTEKMLVQSQAWTGPQRSLIEPHAYLAVHLPRLEQRCEALRQSTQKDIDPYSLEKQKVRDALQTFDQLFDEGHRCLSTALQAFTHLASLRSPNTQERTEQQRTLQDALDFFLPDGLQVTQRSFDEEAGIALRLAERSQQYPDKLAVLEQCKLGTHSLAWVLDQIIEAGKQLDTQVQTRKDLDWKSDPSTREHIARREWINATHSFLRAIDEYTKDEPPFAENARKLRASLEEAVKAAKQKRPQPTTDPAIPVPNEKA